MPLCFSVMDARITPCKGVLLGFGRKDYWFERAYWQGAARGVPPFASPSAPGIAARDGARRVAHAQLLGKTHSQCQRPQRSVFPVAGHAACNRAGDPRRQCLDPGGYPGEANTPLALADCEAVGRHLSKLLATTGSEPSLPDDGSKDPVSRIRTLGRALGLQTELHKIQSALRRIRGRSLKMIPGQTAWAIFEGGAGYLQFMSSVTGDEFLAEIASHKFLPAVAERLTANFVDLVDSSGYQWPHAKENFARWFKIPNEARIMALAEFTIGMLSALFGYRAEDVLEVTIHLPDHRRA